MAKAIGQCRWESPGQWSQWSACLATGRYSRHRWRLPVFFMGMLFADVRRGVTTWLRAAGVSDDFQDWILLPGRHRTQANQPQVLVTAV